MSIARRNPDACIGCRKCVMCCPMDVFYYDRERKKSVIVYPENCQSCGQCYLACPTDSLIMVDMAYAFATTPTRALRILPSAPPKAEG